MWITVPEPTQFIDPETGDRALVPVDGRDPDGPQKELPDRSHEWFLHTFILSHPSFSINHGGAEAVLEAKAIADAVRGKETGQAYEVSADEARRMRGTMSRPSKKDDKEAHETSMGMRPMSNFESMSHVAQIEAILGASVKKPQAEADDDADDDADGTRCEEDWEG